MKKSDILKKAGLRATAARIKILQIFEKGRQPFKQQHMSAEDVYKILLKDKEEIGLATIYRVLAQLESAGFLIRHNFEGTQALYELNDGEHHDHLVCTNCGELDEFFNEIIEEQQHKVSLKKGFKMTGHSLTIYGTCAKCLKKENTPQ